MASTSGALKTLIESANLGVMVVRDRLPKEYRLPAAVISDGVHEADARWGDYGDQTAPQGTTEMAYVDLYQMWRTRQGMVGESRTLARDLKKLLHGSTLPTHDQKVYGVRVDSVVRMVEIDRPDTSRIIDRANKGSDIVHHAFTIYIDRAS